MSVLFAMLMAIVAGCKMKEFSSTPFYSGDEVKFTGKVEDRVNLWPLTYWREPVGSVAWPLVSFGNDHFALRPIYSQYKAHGESDYNEFNFLWPIGQFDTHSRDYRIFPLFWGKSYSDNPYFCLFPALWRGGETTGILPFFWDDSFDEFHIFPFFMSDFSHGNSKQYLFPLYFYNNGDFFSLPYSRYHDDARVKSRMLIGLAGSNSSTNTGYESSWLYPLYYHDNNAFITPLFGTAHDSSWLFPLYYNDASLFFTPVFGKTENAHWAIPLYYKDNTTFITAFGGKSGAASWVLPFFWHDNNTFVSLPYWQRLGKDRKIESASSIPLLSGYERDARTNDRLQYLLMGLGGRVWSETSGNASWVFPFYYKGDNTFYTLLYGHNPRCSWLFPLYYSNEDITLAIPLYGRSKNKNSEWLFPLYYRDDDSFTTPLFGMDKDATWLVPFFYNDDQRTIASPLYGRSKKKNSEWLIPLYHREAGRSFTSLPYSWRGGAEQTNSYFATVLAGTRSGRVQGSWIFPLYDVKKDTSFDHFATILDESRLPDEIAVWKQLCTNAVWNAKTKEYDLFKTEWRQRANSFYSRNDKTFLLLSDADDNIHGHIGHYDKTNTYYIARRKKIGNRLFLNRDKYREVKFNISTREKISDDETAEASFLLFLYNHKRETNLITKNERKRHTVLWRFWHWEEENGNVSLDVFPGFTYDSKTNGYSKTSFLWRFFRYENDPEKGKKVDVLFIPTWR
jgi:hypothetical protein